MGSALERFAQGIGLNATDGKGNPIQNPFAPAQQIQTNMAPALTEVQKRLRAGGSLLSTPQEEEDNLVEVFGKKLVQSALSLPASIATTVTKPIKPLNDVALSFKKFVDEDLEPTLAAEDKIGEGSAYVAGEVLGGFLGGSAVVKGANVAAAKAFSKLPKPMAERAVASISKVADSAAARFNNPQYAELARNAVMQLPKNVANGLAIDVLANPQEFATPQGAAMSTAFTLMGAFMDARTAYRNIAARLKKTAPEDIPAVLEELAIVRENAPALPASDELPTVAQAAERRMRRAEEQASAEALRVMEAHQKILIEKLGPEEYARQLENAKYNVDRFKAIKEEVDQANQIPILEQTRTPDSIENAAFRGQQRRAKSLEKKTREAERRMIPLGGVVDPAGNVGIGALTGQPLKGARYKPAVIDPTVLKGVRGDNQINDIETLIDNAAEYLMGRADQLGMRSNVRKKLMEKKLGSLPAQLETALNTVLERPTKKSINALKAVTQQVNALQNDITGFNEKLTSLEIMRRLQELTQLTDAVEAFKQNPYRTGAYERVLQLSDKEWMDLYNKNIIEQAKQFNPGSPTELTGINTYNPKGKLIQPGKVLVAPETAQQVIINNIAKDPKIDVTPIDKYGIIVPSAVAEKVKKPRIIKTIEAKPTPNSIDEARKQVRDQLAPPDTKSERGLIHQLRKFLRDPYQAAVKGTVGLDRAEKSLVGDVKQKIGESLRTVAQLFNGVQGQIETFVYDKPFYLDDMGNPIRLENRKSLAEIVAPLKDNIDLGLQVEEFAAARHSLDVRKAGIETGISQEAAQMVVDSASPEVRAIADELSEYLRDVYDLGVKEGLFGEDLAKKLYQDRPNYIPLQRVLEAAGVQIDSANRNYRVGVGEVFKELKGSTKQIRNVFLTSIENTEMVVRAAMKNRIGKTLASLVDANPEKAKELGIERIDNVPLSEASTTAEAIMRGAKQEGVNIDAKEALQLSTMFQPFDAKNKILYVWRNGVPVRYRVSDDIALAYESMSPAQLDTFVAIIGAPTQLLKKGVTLNPAFAIANWFRDQFEATLKSQYGYTPLQNAKGLIEAIKRGPAYKEWIAAGGGFGGITTSIPRSEKEQVKQLFGVKTVSLEEALRRFTRPLEESTRLAEYMLARGKGATAAEAAVASRNVTTDFAQVGGQMRAIAHMLPFFNPAIQSLERDRLALFGGNPEAAKRYLTMAMGTLFVPSLALELMQQDDQEIQELKRGRNGENYWYFRLPNDEILRAPKPFLAGQLFGTALSDLAMSIAGQNPRAPKEYGRILFNQIMPPIIPPALGVPLSLMTNTDVRSGVPIIPDGQQNIDPAFQGLEYTSNTARLISQVIPVSPFQIDFAVRNLTGSLGSDVFNSVEWVMGRQDKPAATAKDVPFLGRFFERYPSRSVESLVTFYDDLKTYSNTLNTAKKMAENNPQLAQQYIQEKAEEIKFAPIYAEAKAQIDKLQADINDFRTAPDNVLSAEEKRKYIDIYLRNIITIAQNVNRSVKDIKQ